MKCPFTGWVLFGVLAVSACGHKVTDVGASGESPRPASAGRQIDLFSSNLDFQNVREKLKSSDPKQMTEAIIQMVTMNRRPEVNALLQAAWNQQMDADPELNWNTLQNSQVRIALAQVLGQWYPDDRQYRDYILKDLDKVQGMQRVDDLIALGAVANEADITFLEHTAREADQIVAAGALSGLQIAGGVTATEALKRISDDPSISTQTRELAAQLLRLPRPLRDTTGGP